jgi:hypothetical protein
MGKLNEKLIIYDCMDDFSTSPYGPKDIALKREEKVAKKADLIFATAKSFYGRLKNWNENTYLVQNAADVEMFRKSLANTTPIPEDISAIKPPRIGFVGVIYDQVDLHLIRYVADKRPDWNIVLIGPVGGPQKELFEKLKTKNIHSLPPKPYPIVPNYLKGFDVCIIPFKLTDRAKGMDTMKMYDYLAAGRPVVTTALPEAYKFKDVLKIAETYEEFVEHIEKSLEEKDNRVLIKKRVETAMQNTWDKRVEQIEEIIDEYFKSKKGEKM